MATTMHATEHGSTSAMPLPSPTLTNPEMILPFLRAETPSSRSLSPPLIYPHVLHAAIGSNPPSHATKEPTTIIQNTSSSPLSHSPGHSVGASSVNSDDIESLNWSRFDGATEAGSDIDEGDEERFGSFPQASDGDAERWDTSQHVPSQVEDDEFSSAALSRRADMILANAKKRLSLMEGNLRGARSSLTSPVNSFPSLRSGVSTQDRVVASSLGFSSQRRFQPSQFSSMHHSRMSSESDMATPDTQTVSRNGPLRSSSAMAFTLSAAPDHRGFALRESRSQEQMLLKRWNSAHDRKILAPTSEHSESSEFDLTTDNRHSPSSIQRSPSSTTDLREQMNDLKSRISKLKQRAREDGLKRRSLQHLDTPSPFTSAPDMSFAGAENEVSDNNSRESSNGEPPHIPLHTAPATGEVEKRNNTPSLGHVVDVESHYEDATEDMTEGVQQDDLSRDEDAILNSYDDNDGESIYEDAHAIAPPERHEDRADAFDYEHFFLHSAMGTITHASRRSSVSSHDSVETTRPASPPVADPGFHRRMPSVESISTQASFVTAADVQDVDDSSDAVEQIENALEKTWPNQTFLDSSPTLGTADSARSSHVPLQPPLDKNFPSTSMLATIGDLHLDDKDTTLIAALEESLCHVCQQLDSVKDNPYDRREWRRRLDAARRALDGELL